MVSVLHELLPWCSFEMAASGSSSSTALWQHPFVNLFKQFPLGKHGDVSLVMDRDIRSTVHRVSGAVPAGNYMQVPRAGAHSLGLTGRYAYFLFKPMPTKYFVVHMEAGTREGVAVRVSFSNLFKELKSTSTWLQFPFASASGGSTDPTPRWTLLAVDLQSALATFFNQTYMCLKSVKVCANVFIKGVFTSDQEYTPHHQAGQPCSLTTEPLPREMRLFLPKGAHFSDHYHSFVFPARQPASSSLTGASAPAVSCPPQHHSPLYPAAVRPEHPPTVAVTSPSHAKRSSRANKDTGGTSHLPSPNKARQIVITRHGPEQPLSDAPLLHLERVVGFGGLTCPVLFSANGKEAVFACHHTVVAMDTGSRRQRFFAGHSDKVSSLALSVSGLLASGQGGTQAVVRVWQFSTAQCLALFKAHHSALHELSLSSSGSILLGVGSDRQGRGSVLVWDMSSIVSSGEVRVAAQAHTDVSIRRMKLSFSDSPRMVSCGQGNIRLWRLKGKSLKSCPVDLGCHHQLLFTDVAFPEGAPSSSLGSHVFACTDSGQVLEVHCQTMAISRVWGLSPPTAPIGVTCLKVHECFVVTGHDDGSLCVWPADFSAVLLEAHHDASVGSLDVAQDGMTVLTATLAGTLGVLDAASQEYSVLMRSHTGGVVSGSLHSSGKQLATTGLDQSVRVWQVASGNQTHEFRVAKDAPTSVDIHPVAPLIAVGYQSGAMRVFSLSTSALATEHKQLTSQRSCMLYSPNGAHLYSTTSSGTVAMYDATQETHPLVKVLRGVVSGKQGVKPLAVKRDGSRVAAITASNLIVSILDTAELQEILRLDIAVVARGSDPSNHAVSLCFTTTSLLVLTVLGDLLRFDADSGALTSKLHGLHSALCTSMCATPNGAHLLTSGDHCLKIWDYTSGKPLAPQVYLGPSLELGQILFAGKVCVTFSESICIWVYHGSNAPTHNEDDSSSLAPRGHAPSPVQYTRPLPSIAAPTPLQTFPHHGPGLECTPIPSIPAGQHAATGHSSEASTGLAASDGLGSTAGYHVSEEGDSVSEEGDSVSEEGDSVSEEGDSVSGERDSVSEDGDSVSGDGSNMHEEGDKPSAVDGDRLEAKDGEGCPGSLDNTPVQSTAPASAPLTLLPAPPPQGGGRVRLHSVVGYSGNHRHNLVWHPLRGYMAYSSGSVVVLDHFSTSPQGHLVGHSSPVSALALQSNGRTLASASVGEGEVLLWDIPSLTCTGQLRFHSSAVSSLAYSRDDRFLATVAGARGGKLAVWNTVGYSLLAVAELQEATLDLAWDPFTANRLATVGAGPHLTFWALLEEPSARPSRLQGTHVLVPQELMHTEDRNLSEFTAEAYGPSSKLFVASSSGDVCVWSSVKKVCLFHWRASVSAVTALSWTGRQLVTGAVGRALDLWEVKDSPGNVLKVVHCRSLQLDNTISCTSFEEKGEMGLVGTAQGSVHYISWGESACVKLVSGHSDMVTSCAVWGNSVATTCADGSVSLWCLPLELLASFSTPAKSPTCVDVSPGSSPGRVRCVVGYSDGCLRTFDSKQVAKRVKMKPHDCTVTSVQYSTDGSRVLSGCARGVVAVSSTTSGICLSILSDHLGCPITAINTSAHTLHLPSCGPQPVQMWMVSSQDGRHSIWGSRWIENVHVLVDWLACAAVRQHSVAKFNPSDADLVLYTTPSGADSASVLNTYSISHHKLVGTTPVEFDVTDFDVSHDTSVVAVGDGILALIDCDSGHMWAYRGLSGQLSNVSVVKETGAAICTIDSSIVLWDFPSDTTEAR